MAVLPEMDYKLWQLWHCLWWLHVLKKRCPPLHSSWLQSREIKLTFFVAVHQPLPTSALLSSIDQVVLSKLQRKRKFLDDLKYWNGNLSSSLSVKSLPGAPATPWKTIKSAAVQPLLAAGKPGHELSWWLMDPKYIDIRLNIDILSDW